MLQRQIYKCILVHTVKKQNEEKTDKQKTI